MATRTIEVPDVPFAGFYYPEILRDALTFFRRNVDEIGLTDENDFEVHVQLLRAFAYVGHLNNTRLDTVATELLIDSLTLLESLKRLLRLIGVEVNSATPATVDLLIELSQVITSDTADFIPDLAEFATDAVPPIGYEVIDGVDLNRTDQVDYVYFFKRERSVTDGVFDTAASDTIESATAAFTTADVGKHIVREPEAGAIFNNIGEFRIVEFLSASRVRVVRIPDSEPPGFATESGAGLYIYEFTANGATDVNTAGAPYFQPWASDPSTNDCLYIGHEQALWDQIGVAMQTAISSGQTPGVWEYFDNERSSFNPKEVVDNLDGTLTLDVTTLTGTKRAASGVVIVEYTVTGTKEKAAIAYVGGVNKITTQTLLGQSGTPSTDTDNYLVTADWVPLANQVDGTESGGSFEQDGDVEYDIPQTRERSWLSTDVNLSEAMWIRFRLTGIVTPVTVAEIDRIRIDEGTQYLVAIATQGETVGPKIIGSSDGTARQEFELPDDPYIDNTETIEVDEAGGGNFEEYTYVPNFLSSTATSRHYMRETDAEGIATIIFGDGTNGKIPPSGTDNIRATYRIGGDEDGNVGANEVVVNSDGTPQISSVTNPRAASGWVMKDGGSEEDIERLKREGPAELRTRDTGTTGDDIERLAIRNFTDRNGASPVVRAYAEPEGFGPKTVKLLVVGTGGTTLTGAQLEDLDEYFNGDRYANPPTHGALMLNHEVTSVNYEPRTIDIVTTVVWPNGNAESIRNALLALLQPLSLEEDGTTWTWDFGGTVAISRVYSEIHAVDPTIVRVPTLTIEGVSTSVPLVGNQLPVSTASSIKVNILQN